MVLSLQAWSFQSVVCRILNLILKSLFVYLRPVLKSGSKSARNGTGLQEIEALLKPYPSAVIKLTIHTGSHLVAQHQCFPKFFLSNPTSRVITPLSFSLPGLWAPSGVMTLTWELLYNTLKKLTYQLVNTSAKQTHPGYPRPRAVCCP